MVESSRKKHIDFFYNSKNKRIVRIRAYLDSKGIKIEDLMKNVDLDNNKSFDKLMKSLKDNDFDATKKLLDNGIKDIVSNRSVIDNVTLKNYFGSFKKGYHIQKGTIPQMMFGCGTCPKYKRDTCVHGGNHANGGCSERYLFFAESLKRMCGATVPRMQEYLGELSMKVQDVSERDSREGQAVSKDWLALMKLVGDGLDRLHKAQHGSKVSVRKEITVKDIRKKFYESANFDKDVCDIIDAEVVDDEEEEEDSV